MGRAEQSDVIRIGNTCCENKMLFVNKYNKIRIMNYSQVLICVLLLLLEGKGEECQLQFEEYTEKWNKSYRSEEERQLHEKYFCENIQKIQACNKDETLPYTCNINFMTDRPFTSNLLTKNHTSQTVTAQNVHHLRQDLPDSLDWRETHLVTTVKNQYSCEGSWAFAAAAAAEAKLINQQVQTQQNADLSEQYLIQCTPNSDCSGGYIEEAMKEITDQGLPHEDQWRYDPYKVYSGICGTFGYHIAHEHNDYYDLTNDQMIQLLQDGPVAIGVASQGWENYDSGVFECPINATVDHAAQLVGYTPDYWIVKNQWGGGWGEAGFIRISRVIGLDCAVGSQAHVLFQKQAEVFLFMIFFLYLFL